MENLNKKLPLNKEIIARLNEDQQSSILGGVGETQGCETQNNCAVGDAGGPLTQTCVNCGSGIIGWSAGCTDGCGGSKFTATWLNCTKADCTNDCSTLVCDTGATCTL